jgi:hypothetical protein
VEDLPGRLASIVQGPNLYANASISGNGGGWKEEPRRWPAARSGHGFTDFTEESQAVASVARTSDRKPRTFGCRPHKSRFEDSKVHIHINKTANLKITFVGDRTYILFDN